MRRTDYNYQGEMSKVDADVLDALRGVQMFSALTTTAGTIGLQRSLIKKLNQRRK